MYEHFKELAEYLSAMVPAHVYILYLHLRHLEDAFIQSDL